MILFSRQYDSLSRVPLCHLSDRPRALHAAALSGVALSETPVEHHLPANTEGSSAEYELVDRWGEEGEQRGGFDEPHGICIDADGSLLITDSELRRVYRFTRDGKLLGELSAGAHGWQSPKDVAVDGAGNIFVSDGEWCRILHFDPTGKLVASWGERGAEPGQFLHPHAIAIGQQGRIYIADVDNNRVEVYDPWGKFLFQWGERGTAPGQFIAPHGIAADPEGNVFVSEYEGGRCQKFAADGAHLLTFAASPSGQPLTCYHAVACDRRGDVYLVVRGNSSTERRDAVAKYSNDGHFVTSFAPPRTPGRVFTPNCAAADEKGRLYVTDKGARGMGVIVFAPRTS